VDDVVTRSATDDVLVVTPAIVFVYPVAVGTAVEPVVARVALEAVPTLIKGGRDGDTARRRAAPWEVTRPDQMVVRG
jgi:hypothetical protein